MRGRSVGKPLDFMVKGNMIGLLEDSITIPLGVYNKAKASSVILITITDGEIYFNTRFDS